MTLDASEVPSATSADSVQAGLIQIRTEEKDFGLITDTLFLSYFV